MQKTKGAKNKMKWIDKILDVIFFPVTLIILLWLYLAGLILWIRYRINDFIKQYIVEKQNEFVAYCFFNMIQVIFFIILLPTYVLVYVIGKLDKKGQLSKVIADKIYGL